MNAIVFVSFIKASILPLSIFVVLPFLFSTFKYIDSIYPLSFLSIFV